MTRALKLKSRLLGVNNRNLKTLSIDLATTEQLAAMRPKDKLLVAESGLYSTADLERMHQVGASIFLVGESLMRQADVAAATRTLLGTRAPLNSAA
jgi:indole-3-glycerol phosphate synthase